MRGRLVAGIHEVGGHRVGKFQEQNSRIEQGADCGQGKTAGFIEDQTGSDNGQDEERCEDRKAAARGIDKNSNKDRIGPHLGKAKSPQLPTAWRSFLEDEGGSDREKVERQQKKTGLRQRRNNGIGGVVAQDGRDDAQGAH